MKAVRQQVPTPPVEIIEEVVLTLTPEEARSVLRGLGNTSWLFSDGRTLETMYTLISGALR